MCLFRWVWQVQSKGRVGVVGRVVKVKGCVGGCGGYNCDGCVCVGGCGGYSCEGCGCGGYSCEGCVCRWVWWVQL